MSLSGEQQLLPLPPDSQCCGRSAPPNILPLAPSWEDGELVKKTLDAPDRWEVHSAEEVAVTLSDLPPFRVLQQPNQLVSGGAGNVGVGACLWDGALVLAGYLATQPRYRYVGARCVELGGGVGLVGMALARMGAHCTVTDLAKVLPLLRRNLAANGWDPKGR